MALSELQDVVLNKANEEAEAILQSARRATQRQWEIESTRLHEVHNRRVEHARTELRAAFDRDIGAHKAVENQKLLQIKNEITDNIFQRAVERIRSLPNDGYRQWLKEQIKRVPKIEGSRVAANSHDREMLIHLLKEMDRTDLSPADQAASLQGGFLIYGKQADFDFSVESLLGALRDQLIEQVAAELFAE